MDIAPLTPLIIAIASGIFSLAAIAMQWRKSDAEAAREYATAASSAAEQCERLYKRIEAKETKIYQLEERLTDKDAEISKLSERVSTLERLLREKDLAMTAMVEEQTVLRQKLKEQEDEISVLRQQIVELGSQPRSVRRKSNGGNTGAQNKSKGGE